MFTKEFQKFQPRINLLVECQNRLLAICDENFDETLQFLRSIITDDKNLSTLLFLMGSVTSKRPRNSNLYKKILIDFKESIQSHFPCRLIICYLGNPYFFPTLVDILYENDFYSKEIVSRLIENHPLFSVCKSFHNKKEKEGEISYESNIVNMTINDNISEFLNTVASSNLNLFQKFFDQGNENRSLIEISAQYASINVFKYLWLQIGSDMTEELLKSVYQMAVYGGNYEIIHICEEKIHFAELSDFDQENIMFSAIKGNYKEIIHYLIDQHSIKVTKSHLIISLLEKNLDFFFEHFPKLMNENNIFINFCEPHTTNRQNLFDLLHVACFLGFTELVPFLLLFNFRPLSQYAGRTSIVLAATYGYFDIVKLLCETKKFDTEYQKAFEIAVANDFPQIVEYFSPLVDINFNNSFALRVAVDKGNTEVVRILAKLPNININPLTSIKSTPLHTAAEKGFKEIVLILLENPTIIANQRDNKRSFYIFYIDSKRPSKNERTHRNCSYIG
ncbi:hypothetical protein TRFO_38564 [Tritrichomonas foetus]|uniref:Uncharacterized protein n=1 Tax=Tritrichomonas foetus TaxID=1144522 RepID=A0A1J4J9I8_9EUKA|nr:hypothetical protein TRFO_38564 [Tritrichomonas foetus]|eukprot:OHS95329.1 hypothetical protein TRFO_38564 [Tritrichomonas foetus]